MAANRLIYIPYYLVKTPWRIFFSYFLYVKKKKGISCFRLMADMVKNPFRYNAAPMDYLTLRFFDLTKEERASFACTGFMYEYQLKMNPRAYRSVLQDKIEFLSGFKDFSGRNWASIKMLKESPALAQRLINNSSKKVVIKNATGQAGKQVQVINTTDIKPAALVELMESKGYDLLEDYVVQHDELMNLSPAALNTIRIVTQYNYGKVEVLLAFLRVSVHLNVDNLSAGNYKSNFGAPINIETGKIQGPGVYIDIRKEDEYCHPLTKVELIGFEIPFWKDVVDLAVKAAMHTPQNRSVGWDVGVTNSGPILIEGNHNWNYLTQLPGKRGFRNEFLKYLSNDLP